MLIASAVVVSTVTAAVAGGARQATPPTLLSETGLYAAGRIGTIDASNRPFSPQYPLWSDGAIKRRWIFLPPGRAIDASDDRAWQFPIGTKLWKEFAFGGRKVETRLLWRASTDDWVFASYRWTDDQRDAVLVPEDGVVSDVEIAPGRSHAIPSAGDCRACHESARGVTPLGFNALQLSTDRDPNAIHGEPPSPEMLTVQTLNDEHRLAPARPDLVSAPPRIRAASPATRSVVGYLAANCGGCHQRDNDIVTLGASLKPADVGDGDAVVRAMLSHTTRWQTPGAPTGGTRLIDPDRPELSAIVARMTSRRPSSQMPPLGTIVADREAIGAITRWMQQDLR
jgi:hypothetical protein